MAMPLPASQTWVNMWGLCPPILNIKRTLQECILVVKATILDWFVFDHIVNKVIILTKVAMVLIVTLLLAGRHALWVLSWHIWDEGAEKETILIFFFSWKTYPWWLHSVISLVAMRGHASPCPTKISNKALSHHNWVLCIYPLPYPVPQCCIMLCTLCHTRHHNWVSPYLLYHTVHCLAMYLAHCTIPWSQKPQVHIAFNVSGKRWYMSSGTKFPKSIFSLPHDY